ncbi:hypothetical protein RUM43_006988 [Polyplax serrata]|uniref:DNA polymerase epsilon catalytic subunit n=1 Tax=Polyplax serrata TaxID=468196 RepID=A0AAN8PM17_POLSC
MYKKKSNDINLPQSEESSEKRVKKCIENDLIDKKFGFDRIKDVTEKVGFLVNMHVTEVIDEDKRLKSAVDYYFIEDDGNRFKATLCFPPYFYVLPKKGTILEVSTFLKKKYVGIIDRIDIVSKEDLDLPNHLTGLKQKYLKLSFFSITELLKVRKDIMAAVKKHKEMAKVNNCYSELLNNMNSANEYDVQFKKSTDHLENIIDIREYDIPYHIRVSIDNKIFAGTWYTVKIRGDGLQPILTKNHERLGIPDIIVLAFDIECTKQPLKFPSYDTDQIIMISYMIDGQGFLINNREIISEDVEDFEYTPKPEFEGNFIVYNEPNEKALLQRFFEHITDVKPHVIVTYNGDFFDWPFVENRAAAHGLDMQHEIGFSSKDGVYFCRSIIHMDCLCWVKRDSYLPVGSHNLKAVAKAKLRYDPVELDPEDMCRLAAEEPQVLSNYSVSDAVATYYLYMKYVHPFIFALCTIIPMEPDEILRKGSGTLCETLLMVEAFQARIIFPNKQEQELNKMTSDGHVLDTETYVGGHVEALESGVFRADIPCRFRLIPEAFETLIREVRRTLEHAIEEEEKIPLAEVLNLEQVLTEIEAKLSSLRDNPIRYENPVIYHLDVGAMYPNIILTDRLQPYAIVDEEDCASCDFNTPGAVCQKKMKWMWRGEMMPASRSEFQRLQQQLESEKFPPEIPGGPPRAFHQLSKQEQATYEKKRLTEYCRKAYKKIHVTRVEERETTICQKENSFYVDTVRAFRDRRYEYKGLCKVAKKQVSEAIAKGDAGEIKNAKNLEVLYDSLQLAHKCILNSFYGYVMRKGARWHSMHMAGVVCHKGASIITKAREIIEQVGRPLELDTDGIWCVLPDSFPQNFDILTTNLQKKKITISFPNAVLNCMVKDFFTNHVYFDLVDPQELTYVQKSENSIFFEVDGPYLAMILPASKEEGKKLKKRYAVFNFDKSLAELKGFEVKRRGELQLIKIFQSSVFDAFLKGDTLENCYKAVAKIADYWLDILYSKAETLPDSELFELISENRSMSKKLEEYGTQKSTSISTAKRLAEFLGDQMVKDKGLSCRYIISRKPEGSPVTERAIPLAIFQSEPSVKRHYLRKWLKDNSLTDIDIRQVLDWNYYIERLNGAIQKIITIPAALQGVDNPVPRVRHPDWLHKKILEKTDTLKQRKVNEFFVSVPKSEQNTNVCDIEETAQPPAKIPKVFHYYSVTKKRKRNASVPFTEEDLSRHWKEVLGPPPPRGKTKDELIAWIRFHKRKWELQWCQRKMRQGGNANKRNRTGREEAIVGTVPRSTATIGGFIKKAQQNILENTWQVIQYAKTNEPGLYRVWAIIGKDLHQIKVTVPRIFYVNQRTARNEDESNVVWKKVNRILPRSKPVYNLYEYSVPESVYQSHSQELLTSISSPDVEGIYETKVPLDFRLIVQLGCLISVDRAEINKRIRSGSKDADNFTLNQLNFVSIHPTSPYLKKSDAGTLPFKTIFLYQHSSKNSQKSIYGVFLEGSKSVHVYLLDTVKNIQVPNLQNVYVKERGNKISKGFNESDLPTEDMNFEVHAANNPKEVYKSIQHVLSAYKSERPGASVILLQTFLDCSTVTTLMPGLLDFPIVKFHTRDPETLYSTMEWQKLGTKLMINHFLNANTILNATLEQSRYFHAPIGNVPADATLFGADLFYARHLLKNNFVLWCSDSELPDLGGSETDDSRLLSDFEEFSTTIVNREGCYTSIVVELDIDSLAVNTLLQLHHVNDAEGISSSVAFDSAPQVMVDDMISGINNHSSIYDESAVCSPAFKVLRSVAGTWIRDVSMFKNMYADYQIVHFYRWVRSPNAILYDPAIRKMMHNMMKKLFLQLLAEFKRLGAIVVFANFNKVVICTKKNTFENAVGYIDFIESNIRQKELFHGIQLTAGQSWHLLLWLDNVGTQSNFGGIKIKDLIKESKNKMRNQAHKGDENGDEGETTEQRINENCKGDTEKESNEDSETEDSQQDMDYAIVMNWNLSDFLLPSIKPTFDEVVVTYLNILWSQMKKEYGDPSTPRIRRITDSQSQPELTPCGTSETLENFAKELVSKEMPIELFGITEKINRTHPATLGHKKSSKLGSKSQVHFPALDFVKSICKVLSLNASTEKEVDKLNSNMLRLIGVREFDDEAVWKDPCQTVVLTEVVCKTCSHCRDIDLCKDLHVTEINGQKMYKCPVCQSPYSKDDLEYLLLDMVQRNTMAYTIQDLQCKKCLEVKSLLNYVFNLNLKLSWEEFE